MSFGFTVPTVDLLLTLEQVANSLVHINFAVKSRASAKPRFPWCLMIVNRFSISGTASALEWVDWFNNRRLLEPIGNIPPAEAEELLLRHTGKASHGGVT